MMYVFILVLVRHLNQLILQVPKSHMSTGLCPYWSTSLPAPCLSPEKTMEDGLKPCVPEPTSETLRGLLAYGFGSLNSGCRGFLRSDQADG